MKSVILCGGKGTRYNNINNNKPKSLSMIGDKPIIHHLLEILYRQNHNDFILALGFKGNYIEKYFDLIKHNYNIKFAYTKPELDTAGRLKEVESYIKNNDKFMCIYGDGLANINIKNLIEQNEKNVFNNLKPIVTMSIVKPYNNYGVVSYDVITNRVLEFIEKPRMNEWINAGFFVFNRKIFDYIKNESDSLESDIFPKLVKEKRINIYKHEDFFETLNTLKDEIRLNDIYNKCVKNNETLKWYDLK